MRIAGVALVFLGIVLVAVGLFQGCGGLFTWNGRHPIEVVPLTQPSVVHTLVPVPGRRYTLSVEVVFDREGLPTTEEGTTTLEAKLPLVVRVKDQAGTALADVMGWLDPSEPPSVLHGQFVPQPVRGPMPELAVTRLVGPFGAASASPLAIEVSLGEDRVGRARAVARRLVIHDDAIPKSIQIAFAAAAAGAVALLAGIVVSLVGWLRRRGRPRARKASA